MLLTPHPVTLPSKVMLKHLRCYLPAEGSAVFHGDR